MKEQVLDKPEEKRLFGLDLFINAYHIINPDKGELLISAVKKFDAGMLAALIIFGGSSGFFIFLAIDQAEPGASFPLHMGPLIFAVIIFIPFLLVLFLMLTNKMRCHFTEDELIYTSAFGRKKRLSRKFVVSVFITETIREVNNRNEGFRYSVDLKLRFQREMNDQYRLLDIKEKNSITSVIGGMNYKSMNIARDEALRIAEIIANHWNVPVSV